MIDLYSFPAPDGQTVGIALEVLGHSRNHADEKIDYAVNRYADETDRLYESPLRIARSALVGSRVRRA
jgi:hypothetical protein